MVLCGLDLLGIGGIVFMRSDLFVRLFATGRIGVSFFCSLVLKQVFT